MTNSPTQSSMIVETYAKRECMPDSFAVWVAPEDMKAVGWYPLLELHNGDGPHCRVQFMKVDKDGYPCY